jgi:pilus assembly protein CpaB
MNKNILIVIGGAFAVAVLVAMLVQLTLGGKKQPVEEARVEILVANADLGIGRELQPGDIRWQTWPKSNVFPGAILREGEKKPEEVVTGRLARDIGKDEPILKSAMLAQASGNLVAARLEPGMRALAIEVDASAMIGGFVGPGDRVDVILTYKANVRSEEDDMRVKEMIERNLDERAVETILQNILVLAVDQNAERPEDDKIKVGKTVTLALTVKDAEKLSLASEMGDLMLALRGVGDEAILDRDWPTVSDKRMTSITDEIFDEYKKIKKQSGDSGETVRIYNGGTVVVQPTAR